MFTRLVLAHFGRFRDTQIPLRSSTIVHGGNESGKTTVFDALVQAACRPSMETAVGVALAQRYGERARATLEGAPPSTATSPAEMTGLLAAREGELHFGVDAGNDEIWRATRIEILTPDFRGRLEAALDILGTELPDVMNHNLETVPRLYRLARPGADYAHSLKLLRDFKAMHPAVATKSGLMVGLGETDEEIVAVMRDLRAHGVEMLTVGQYLRPSNGHLPVERYVPPETFQAFERAALEMGFRHAACGPMVRSSYHADQQAHGAGVA